MKMPGDMKLFLEAARENGGTLTQGMMDAIIFQNRTSSDLVRNGTSRAKGGLRVRGLLGHTLSGQDRDRLIHLGIYSIRHQGICSLVKRHGAQKAGKIVFIPKLAKVDIENKIVDTGNDSGSNSFEQGN